MIRDKLSQNFEVTTRSDESNQLPQCTYSLMFKLEDDIPSTTPHNQPKNSLSSLIRHPRWVEIWETFPKESSKTDLHQGPEKICMIGHMENSPTESIIEPTIYVYQEFWDITSIISYQVGLVLKDWVDQGLLTWQVWVLAPQNPKCIRLGKIWNFPRHPRTLAKNSFSWVYWLL